MSVNLQFTLIAGFACLVAIWNIAHMAGTGHHDYARWLMCAVLLTASAGFVLQIAVIAQGIDRLVGVPNVSVLLTSCIYLGCAGLIHLWISTWPGIWPGSAHTARMRLALVYTLFATMLVALFSLGRHPHEHPYTFAEKYVHDPATAMFLTGYLLAFTSAWLWAAVRVHRGRQRARTGDLRWLEFGLAFLETGLWFTIAYCLSLAAVPVMAANGMVDSTRWFAPFSSALGALSATFICIGFSCRTWGPSLDRFLQRRFPGYVDRGRYRRLAPLHLLVDGARSRQIRTPRGLGVSRTNARAALTHQTLSITEALETLSPYYDAHVTEEATAWGRAVAEAIIIDAALTAQRNGTRPLHTAPMTFGDLETETRRYERLSTAITMIKMVDLGQPDTAAPAANTESAHTTDTARCADTAPATASTS